VGLAHRGGGVTCGDNFEEWGTAYQLNAYI
jgi:hypothetical protein